MNPVTVELLNGAEKYRRSKQVEACQLQNQAEAKRSRRPGLPERVTRGLGVLLNRSSSRAQEGRTSPGRTVPG
jgi:hypothetical protein